MNESKAYNMLYFGTSLYLMFQFAVFFGSTLTLSALDHDVSYFCPLLLFTYIALWVAFGKKLVWKFDSLFDSANQRRKGAEK